MGDATVLKTGLKVEGGRATSTFSGHVDVRVAGLMSVAERPDAWSPPHLLVAASESCFFLTFSAIAEKMRAGIASYASSAEARLESREGKHEIAEIVIRPAVRFANDADREKLPQLIRLAEEHCPVARSLKATVRIEIIL